LKCREWICDLRRCAWWCLVKCCDHMISVECCDYVTWGVCYKRGFLYLVNYMFDIYIVQVVNYVTLWWKSNIVYLDYDWCEANPSGFESLPVCMNGLTECMSSFAWLVSCLRITGASSTFMLRCLRLGSDLGCRSLCSFWICFCRWILPNCRDLEILCIDVF